MPCEPCISHLAGVTTPVTRSRCSLYIVTWRFSSASTLVRAVTTCTVERVGGLRLVASGHRGRGRGREGRKALQHRAGRQG